MSASFRKKNKSFRKIMKSKGPKTDPWDTPNIKYFQELKNIDFSPLLLA